MDLERRTVVYEDFGGDVDSLKLNVSSRRKLATTWKQLKLRCAILINYEPKIIVIFLLNPVYYDLGLRVIIPGPALSSTLPVPKVNRVES